jgi:glycosyltransferase involved in cell wall biosynthesis
MSQLKFSVLLAVYYKENPVFLTEALDSVINQSILPTQIIIVKDGPLTQDLDFVINNFMNSNSAVQIKVIPLKENLGLGRALNIGLKECDYDWVARMDSDDICRFDRFELILKQIANSKNISVFGSYIDEFRGDVTNIVQQRKVKLNHDDIEADLSNRNPMNHVTVFFNKKDVLSVGSYEDVLFFEDYQLWTKMILNKMIFKNIPESTVLVRIGDDMIGRRHGFFYAKLEFNFQKYLLKKKFITRKIFFRNMLFRVFVRILPKVILNQIYKISRLI